MPPADMEKLLRHWRPFLLSVTRSVCRSAVDVDDAFQEAQLIFVEVYPKFPGGHLHGWLAMAVKRRLYSWFSAQRARRSREWLVDDFRGLDASVESTEVAILDRLQQQGWIDRLSPEHAEAVNLCLIEGLQQSRAAKKAGIKPNTMKSRLDRACKRLRVIAREGGQ